MTPLNKFGEKLIGEKLKTRRMTSNLKIRKTNNANKTYAKSNETPYKNKRTKKWARFISQTNSWMYPYLQHSQCFLDILCIVFENLTLRYYLYVEGAYFWKLLIATAIVSVIVPFVEQMLRKLGAWASDNYLGDEKHGMFYLY